MGANSSNTGRISYDNDEVSRNPDEKSFRKSSSKSHSHSHSLNNNHVNDKYRNKGRRTTRSYEHILSISPTVSRHKKVSDSQLSSYKKRNSSQGDVRKEDFTQTRTVLIADKNSDEILEDKYKISTNLTTSHHGDLKVSSGGDSSDEDLPSDYQCDCSSCSNSDCDEVYSVYVTARKYSDILKTNENDNYEDSSDNSFENNLRDLEIPLKINRSNYRYLEGLDSTNRKHYDEDISVPSFEHLLKDFKTTVKKYPRKTKEFDSNDHRSLIDLNEEGRPIENRQFGSHTTRSAHHGEYHSRDHHSRRHHNIRKYSTENLGRPSRYCSRHINKFDIVEEDDIFYENSEEKLHEIQNLSNHHLPDNVSEHHQRKDRNRRDIFYEEVCAVPSVVAYDELLSGPFKTFLECSNTIGGDVAEIAKIVEATFKTQRAFLVAAAKSKKPTEQELPKILEPTGTKIQAVMAFRESKRTSKYFNHLSAISESIPGLSWVAVEPTPAPYIKEMGDAAVFYTNRVLKDYREKDKLHVEWVQNWNNVFKELQAYIRQYHTTGLTWNPKGGNAADNLKAPTATVAPPPPPAGGIPPPPPMVKLEMKPIVADDGRGALFDSLNKGSDITTTLKKVSDDMKVQKNPDLRDVARPVTVIASPIPTGVRGVSPFSGPSKPPKFALEGKKWFVEYQKDKPDICVSQTRMDQSVYIYRCDSTVVQVKGKINSIIMDSCRKTSVVFDSLVSSMEIVNCQSCKMQVMQQMPTITIEKTDGCQVYLSAESLHTEIVSAKSSEMNILIPKPDGDFVECPVPEQFKTVINGTRLVTSCTEKAG